MLSKKEIVKEVIKAGKDPIYFINNYAKISHPIKGQIPFRTYPFQNELLKSFNDYQYNVVLKARQLGISTVTAAYISWLLLFHKEKNVLILATNLDVATNIVKKVKLVVKSVPSWMRIAKIKVDNKHSFELDNGSQIKAASKNPTSGRSEALSLLVIDEAAHVDDMDEKWTAIYPTISTGGRCIALSTPNGIGNWFYKVCSEAETKENDFHLTKLLWSVHPDRNQEWYEKETRNMSRRQIAQELECNFNTSGDTVFHPEDIARVFTSTSEPHYRTGFDRNLWIWEKYVDGGSYFISADVARGDGEDYSVFHVFRADTMEIVAEYRGKLPPDLFSEILISAGKEYKDCMIVVENNTVGFSVLQKLKEKEYPNIYYSIKSTHEYIDQHRGEHMQSAVAGFSSTSKTRPIIIAKLEEFIRNDLIKINSVRFSNEMKTFIWNHGRAQAQRRHNDDLVMACAIGCWVKDAVMTVNTKGVAASKAIVNSIFTSRKTLDTTIDGMLQSEKNRKMSSNKKTQDQFVWLLKG